MDKLAKILPADAFNSSEISTEHILFCKTGKLSTFYYFYKSVIEFSTHPNAQATKNSQ